MVRKVVAWGSGGVRTQIGGAVGGIVGAGIGGGSS